MTLSTSGLTRADLESAARLVHATLAPTPQICWPLLSERVGAEVWVKHENHLPTGAFKVRGGLVYLDHLRRTAPEVREVIGATRGNHGQSVGFAARRAGLEATIVVPRGNSRHQNAAMRALGVSLIEHGRDFEEAREHSIQLAKQKGLHLVPSWHPLLVRGVATYGLEWLAVVSDLDTVYVPIGLGSGICGLIAARDALGLSTRIVGVVAEQAPAYALSFARRTPVSTETSHTMADGIATRVPYPDALAIILAGAERVVTVSEQEIQDAIRWYFSDTHNVAEGAGAAGLAALMQEREVMKGKRVGLVLSGGNIDREAYAAILGSDPGAG
jgi:threonine dehydratase